MVRIAAFAIGAVATLLAIPTQRLNIALGAGLAVVASANLPALLYNLFWKRFNTMGATFSIYCGLIMAVLLVTFSPVVSGTPTSLAPSANFNWFLLRNPGLISIPSGFLCGLVGTLISKEVHSAERYDELSVRAFTGAGAEKAVVHQEALDLTRSEVSSDRQNRTSLVVFVPTVAAKSTRNPPIRPPDRHLSDSTYRCHGESAVIRTRRSPP